MFSPCFGILNKNEVTSILVSYLLIIIYLTFVVDIRVYSNHYTSTTFKV